MGLKLKFKHIKTYGIWKYQRKYQSNGLIFQSENNEKVNKTFCFILERIEALYIESQILFKSYF